MQDITLPPLPAFPDVPFSTADRVVWTAWAEKYARQAVIADRERKPSTDYYVSGTTPIDKIGASIAPPNIMATIAAKAVGNA